MGSSKRDSETPDHYFSNVAMEIKTNAHIRGGSNA